MTHDEPQLTTAIAISLGAIPGALCRYYFTIGLARWLGTRFPFGTFAINLSGALLMGFFATLAIAHVTPSPALQSMITTGFLGSYTTFSTYALDTVALWHSGDRLRALIYWLSSMVLGGLCLVVGIMLAGWVSA